MKFLFLASALVCIFGCFSATASEFPWIVQLEWANDTVCNGAIMSEDFIVLLAQCVHNTDTPSMIIRSGSDRQHFGSTHSLQDIRIHPDFIVNDVYGWQHDIAVVRVHPPITFSEKTKPISIGSEYPNSGNKGYGIGFSNLNNKLVRVGLKVDNSNLECVMDEIGQLFCAGTASVEGACLLGWGAPFIQDDNLYGLATIIETCKLFNTYVSVALPTNKGFIERVLRGNG